MPALLGNPFFIMTEFLKPRIGAHSYKAQRMDGRQDFVIDKNLVGNFATVEAGQFSSVNAVGSENIWGIFGDNDPIAHFEPLFLKYYKHSFHFPGRHTPTAEEVRGYYVPLTEQLMSL